MNVTYELRGDGQVVRRTVWRLAGKGKSRAVRAAEHRRVIDAITRRAGAAGGYLANVWWEADDRPDATAEAEEVLPPDFMLRAGGQAQ